MQLYNIFKTFPREPGPPGNSVLPLEYDLQAATA